MRWSWSFRFALLWFSYLSIAIATESFACLTDGEALNIVADFAIIASDQPGSVKVAKHRLAADFTSITYSVNFVDGIPVSVSQKPH
jgi:hypothetical protein